uniref:Uncharacterized protein n=1 Tax=Chondria sp. (in: red algae) TaxID=1982705 RepID=A0A1Z1MQ19_9FLOR|nr:hypothetical protein [Chondria sp. (in: red algae)]
MIKTLLNFALQKNKIINMNKNIQVKANPIISQYKNKIEKKIF